MQTIQPLTPVTEQPSQAQLSATKVSPAPVAKPTLNFDIQEQVVLDIKFPWGLLNESLTCIFINKSGQLMASTTPPAYNETTDDFVLDGEAVYFGEAPAYVQYWRKSITLRPEVTGTVDETVEEPVVEEPKEDVVHTYDWEAASNNACKREAKRLRANNVPREQWHPALLKY